MTLNDASLRLLEIFEILKFYKNNGSKIIAKIWTRKIPNTNHWGKYLKPIMVYAGDIFEIPGQSIQRPARNNFFTNFVYEIFLKLREDEFIG